MTPRAAASLCVLAVAWPQVAAAHLGSTKLVWLDVDGREVSARVDLDPIDVAYALELEAPDDATAERALARPDDLRAWAGRVFEVRDANGACESEVGAPAAVEVDGALRMTRAVRVPISFRCGDPPERFLDEAVFDSDAQHEAIVRIGESTTILRAGRQEMALEPTAERSTVLTFLVEGAIHLITGYDHILFLLSLLLVAGEVARRDGTKKAMADVAWMVTAFTLGHSITLIAAALDVVVLPSRLVESAIAASIVAVAAWNVVRPEARAELRWVAGAFGLIHGFGFSSVLRELVLPTGERVTALLSFNVGIELAQLVIVVMVVPLLGVLARWGRYRDVVVRGGSALIGAVGLYWFVQRALAL